MDLIVSTGCVGYVTKTSFARLLGLLDPKRPKPWIASFVLRAVDFEPIERTLAEAGLITEKFEGMSFVQRRFADIAEMEQTLDLLRARGLDPSQLEARGMLHAELYVSRPAEAIAAMPLQSMLKVSAGINKPYLTAARALCGAMIEPGGFAVQ